MSQPVDNSKPNKVILLTPKARVPDTIKKVEAFINNTWFDALSSDSVMVNNLKKK